MHSTRRSRPARHATAALAASRASVGCDTIAPLGHSPTPRVPHVANEWHRRSAARLIVLERLRGGRRDRPAATHDVAPTRTGSHARCRRRRVEAPPGRCTRGDHTPAKHDTMSHLQANELTFAGESPSAKVEHPMATPVGMARAVAGPGMAPVRGVPASPRAGLSALGRCGPSRVLRQTRAARGLLEMAGMERAHPGLGSSAASLPHVSGRAGRWIDRCDPLVLRP